MSRTFYIKTFGCQMNVFDSNRMRDHLLKAGYQPNESMSQSDVVLINTCSIRDKSEQKVLSLLGEMKPLKDERPDKVFGITGCVGQRMGRTLLQKVPHLDLVMGPDAVSKVSELVEEVRQRGKRVVYTEQSRNRKRDYTEPLAKLPEVTPVSEFITVMRGCDHFCTYCIVPFVRGREQSRPITEVIEETKALVQRGTREITYLGQNINTYGKGTEGTLAELVRQANEIEDLERVRYVTSHPHDLGEDLIEQFGSVDKLCPQLHLPFQSGSDAVLKRMSRLYTQAEYLEKIRLLRKACPDIALSTDVIVGFPGETEDDFKDTLKVLSEVGFSSAFMFKYSPRPGTRAENYGDQVPEEVQAERLKRAQDVVYPYIQKENVALIEKTQKVLVEKLDKKGKYFFGRTPHSKLAHIFNAGEACVGKVLDVEITEATGTNLKGYATELPRIKRDQVEC